MTIENIYAYLQQVAHTQQILFFLLLSSSAVHLLLFWLVMVLYKRSGKKSKPAIVLPDIYKGELNNARIKAYQELLKEFKVEEGTARHIFGMGANFYKEVVREANDKTNQS